MNKDVCEYTIIQENIDNIDQSDNCTSFDQSNLWYTHFIKYFHSPEDVIVLSAVDTSQDKIASLFLTTATIQPNKLQCLFSLSNYYSSRAGIVFYTKCTEQQKRNITELIIKYIRKKLNHFHCIYLEPLRNNDQTTQYLTDSLKANKYWCISYVKSGNWYHQLTDNKFDTYFEKLPSRVKNTITRKRNHIEKNYDFEIKISHKYDDILQLFGDYETVYRKSWKKTEPHPEFIKDFALASATKGWARLGILYIENKPIAAQLWFVKDRIASIFKLSYDQEYKSLSAGSILTVELIRYAVEIDNVNLLDYLTGDDNYKKDWMSNRSELLGLNIYNPHSITGFLIGLSEIIKHRLGKVLKFNKT